MPCNLTCVGKKIKSFYNDIIMTIIITYQGKLHYHKTGETM